MVKVLFVGGDRDGEMLDSPTHSHVLVPVRKPVEEWQVADYFRRDTKMDSETIDAESYSQMEFWTKDLRGSPMLFSVYAASGLSSADVMQRLLNRYPRWKKNDPDEFLIAADILEERGMDNAAEALRRLSISKSLRDAAESKGRSFD